MTKASDHKITSYVVFVIYGLLLAGIYYSTFTWLVEKDWSREDYSHGYLIPFIVLYLIWDKKADLKKTASNPGWIGILPFLFGVGLFWLGELAGEFFTLYVSFWFIVLGLLWLHLGGAKLKMIGFPVFLILTMFPLPHFLYDRVSFNLKLISSKLGVAMMQLYGMSVFREGNIIDLGFTQLQVVDACSGLRFLIPLIVLGIVLAYFFKAAIWKRALLILSTVPLSIITNSLRIAMTGILYQDWGPKAAEGFFHGFSGWFIFMFSLAVLLLEMWLLKKLPPKETKPQTLTSEPEDDTKQDEDDSPESQPVVVYNILKSPQFIIATVFLLFTVSISYSVEFREKIPLTKSLSQFPEQLGDWKGSSQTMEEKFVITLDLSDYRIVNYYDPKGHLVNFYTAYYESQRKGESIHSPATCLPGGGWRFKNAGSINIPFPGRPEGAIKVNRAVMEKGEHKQLAYYWFAQRGRILTNAFQLKFYVFWDALTKQRTDGALVRIITPVSRQEKIKDADERLKSFTKQLVPILDQFIPGQDADLSR